MSANLSTLAGVTAVLVGLVGVVVIALLGFRSAARATRREMGDRGDTTLLSVALQDALTRLAAQERATNARATASEQLSAQVFDSLTAGLIVVDAAGLVKIVNPAAARMLGVESDLAGRTYADLLARTPPLVSLIDEGLATQQPISRRTVGVSIDDHQWHFGVTVSPLADAEAKHGVICLFSDLTAVVELEQQLQLKEALARLGELTAGIAHEFRNGLATIHGYSRLIELDAIPQRFRPCVEGIRQESDALGHIVTNFLNFARPEQVLFSPLDMESIVRKVAADLRAELGTHVQVDVTGSFGAVAGDEIMLRQLFANLIRNAAEACEGGGVSPCIAIEGRIDADVELTRIAVCDNGPGIDARHRHQVFQPFFTTRSRGSGLGLPIVQKIALLHNGSVTVGSSNTGGARIDLALPLANAA